MATQRMIVEFPSYSRPTTNISMILLAGIALIIESVILFWAYSMKGTFIRDLFMGRNEINLERIILQGATLFMWSLSISNVILKNIRVSQEKKILRTTLLPENLDILDEGQLVETFNKVKDHPLLKKRLVLTRLVRVLAMWINTRDYERTAECAREESELDVFSADSSYRMNRLFIWAMPLLGFVGTVYGVAYGIGGFADFLKGAVTAEGIKTQVGLITQGLAVAFYCTLLGLCSAGIASFPSLAAERKEEGMLEDLGAYVDDRLISHMPSVKKAEFPVDQIVAIRQGIENIHLDLPVDAFAKAMENIKIDLPMDSLVRALEGIKFDFPTDKLVAAMEGIKFDFPVETLAKAIEKGLGRLPDPDRYEQVFSTAVARASDLVNDKYTKFAQTYETHVDGVGGALSSQLERVAAAFMTGAEQLARQLEGHTAQMMQLGQGQNQQLAAAHEKYVGAVQQLDQKELARWEKMVADFGQLSVKVAEQFRGAASAMDSATDRYTERVQVSTQELAKQLEAITSVGKDIDKLLNLTASMEKTMSEISDAEEFRETLMSLRNHLNASDQLVKNLSKPRQVVLQEMLEG